MPGTFGLRCFVGADWVGTHLSLGDRHSWPRCPVEDREAPEAEEVLGSSTEGT